MVNPITEMLQSLNRSLAEFGMGEKVLLAQDVPVVLTLADGRKLRSTVRLHWTESGPAIPDPEGQVKRLAALVGGAGAMALPKQGDREPNGR